MTLKANDLFGWALQSTAGGLTYGSVSGYKAQLSTYPRLFRATSTGVASAGNKIRSTTLAAYMNTSDDLPGFWVEVVCMSTASGRELGAPIRRPIVKYDHGLQRLYVWKLPGTIANGDQFHLLQPPHAWISMSTQGQSTYVCDKQRNNTDLAGYTQIGGYYVEVVRASSVATTNHPRVSSWTAATGKAGLTPSLAASTFLGDLFECWQYPEVDALLDLTKPRLARAPVRGQAGRTPGVAGLWEGSGTQNIPFIGAGNTRIGDTTQLDVPFAAAMLASTIADWTPLTGSGSSAGTIVSATNTPAVVGKMYATGVGGDVFVVTAQTTTNVSVSPNLRTVPGANVQVYGCRQYRQQDAPTVAVSCKQYRGREVVEYAWGCIPSITIKLTRGEKPMVTLNWQVGDHSGPLNLDHNGTAISRSTVVRAKLPSITPRAIGHARCSIGNVELECRTISIDLGLVWQPKTDLSAPNGFGGWWRAEGDPTVTIECWLDTDTKAQLDPWLQGQDQTLLIQSGAGLGDPGILAFWAYKTELTGVVFGDENGISTTTLNAQVVLDRTETTLSPWLLGTF